MSVKQMTSGEAYVFMEESRKKLARTDKLIAQGLMLPTERSKCIDEIRAECGLSPLSSSGRLDMLSVSDRQHIGDLASAQAAGRHLTYNEELILRLAGVRQ